VKRQGDECDDDAKIAQGAPAVPQVRNQQGEERDSVKPNGAIKCFEMVIEIFQPQIGFCGIDRWRKCAQLFPQQMGGATKFE